MTHRSIICFCKYHFIGIQSCPFIYILFIAALPQQSWVVPRVHTAQSLKYLLAGHLRKFVIPCRMYLEPLSWSVHRASLIHSMTKYPTVWLYTIMYQNLLRTFRLFLIFFYYNVKTNSGINSFPCTRSLYVELQESKEMHLNFVKYY